ncbi:MAG: hypothetical protein OEV08_15475, partial [Nitrospira sp.]|nr:hypothetical protein [Nitrospira sp.]
MNAVEKTEIVRQGIDIRVVDNVETFESLSGAWDRLLEVAEDVSVFVSWEWLFHWWKHYGKRHELRILTSWEHGRLTGILPLYIQEISLYRHFHVRLVRFL